MREAVLDEACELVADDIITMLRLQSHVTDAELRDNIRHALRAARPKKSVSVSCEWRFPSELSPDQRSRMKSQQ